MTLYHVKHIEPGPFRPVFLCELIEVAIERGLPGLNEEDTFMHAGLRVNVMGPLRDFPDDYLIIPTDNASPAGYKNRRNSIRFETVDDNEAHTNNWYAHRMHELLGARRPGVYRPVDE